MPDMLRSFVIPFTRSVSSRDPEQASLNVRLHEPSLTGDNLGLKTWASSLLLSKRLQRLRSHLPPARPRVLELGSGTGLVGIAAACLWSADVTLSDLPEIVPNLQKNVRENSKTVQHHGGTSSVRALDWSDSKEISPSEDEKFPVVIGADPLYSPEHPRLLVETIKRWLRPTRDARFVVELPLRGRYDVERAELKQRLTQAHLRIEDEGEEVGYDDWIGYEGQLEVTCWWAVWKPEVASGANVERAMEASKPTPIG